jgi:hypothetical protein
MSTSKLDTSGVFDSVSVHGAETRLSLPAHAVRIRKNGIEFQSSRPISLWTEMTVELYSPRGSKKVRGTGVVVDCHGNRHSGYLVAMVFMNLSRQAQASLSLLAYS